MKCLTITEDIKDRFRNLIFNEKRHTYTVDGVNYASVSSLIKSFYKPFDSDSVSGFVSVFKGIPKKDLLNEWKHARVTACNLGNNVHNFGEGYAAKRYDLEGNTTYYKKSGRTLLPQEAALIKFWDDKPEYYVPISLELRMYSSHWQYAGTTDIVLLDTRTNTLVIGDYKTNKDLHKQYKDQRMLGIFSHLRDTPFSRDEVQLSLYQILLEQTGYSVSRRFIVWLKADGTYLIMNTTDYTERLKEFLHKKKINENW